MESLALLATLVMLFVFSSSILAFSFSWAKNKVMKILTFIFSGLGLASGLWVMITLINGNGLFIGVIPVLLSGFAIWNTIKRTKQ
jgi:hypothetical protein